MPRFVPERWRPVDDSSTGYKTFDPECVVLQVSFRAIDEKVEPKSYTMGCPCGCGGFPNGEKTTFCMGHDARLRGILIRAHLMGVKIRYILGDVVSDPIDAAMVAEGHFWTSYLDEAVERREAKNKEVVRRALQAEEGRLLKVARWSVTGGQVIAIYQDKKEGMHWIEWVDRAGNSKTARVRADESPLAEIAQQQVSA